MSLFKHIAPSPPDPIFGVAFAYEASKHPNKQILAVGVYRTEEGKPHVFEAVRKAETNLLAKNHKDYLPMTGHPGFVQKSKELLYGPVLNQISDRVGAVQTVAGTGAASVAGVFSRKFLNPPTCLISDPAWPNYNTIFGEAGLKLSYYPYVKDGRINLSGTLNAFENAPNGSMVVLQACAHNPSGVDPTPEQWKEILNVIDKKNHTIIFDFAYLGFGSGDIEKDAEIIRQYALTGRQFLVAFSYSKCMGLYGERIGCLHSVGADSRDAKATSTNFASILRSTISVAPMNGALLVNEVLSNPELKQIWINELKDVTGRIINIRGKLVNHLEQMTQKSWSYLKEQRGMFGFTGLNIEQVKRLAEIEGVFITNDGRISVPAINNKNVYSIAKSIANVVNN